MFVGVLRGISYWGRKFAHYVAKGIERGLSKVGIARVLRRWFKEYTVSEIYNDYELIKEAKETWRRMRYIRRDRRISEKFYKASYKRLKNRYLTTFELDIINLDTGAREKRYVTVGHERLRLRRTLERDAVAIAKGTSPRIVIEKIKPVSGVRSVRPEEL